MVWPEVRHRERHFNFFFLFLWGEILLHNLDPQTYPLEDLYLPLKLEHTSSLQDSKVALAVEKKKIIGMCVCVCV